MKVLPVKDPRRPWRMVLNMYGGPGDKLHNFLWTLRAALISSSSQFFPGIQAKAKGERASFHVDLRMGPRTRAIIR